MKNIFFITIFISFYSLVCAQTSLQYEMASYSGAGANASDRAETRFLNLAMFNQPYFQVNYTNFSKGIQDVFDLIIGVSIATAVVVFMLAAFQQIVNGGNIRDIKKGKDGMWNAIVGLMIILSTWLILNTINPDLLRLPMLSGLDNLKASQQAQSQPSVTAQSAEAVAPAPSGNIDIFTPSETNIAP